MRRTWLAGTAFVGILAGLPVRLHATYARVESMGKSATFFMDDVSIFDNPANMNIFPNFLIGELGTYRLPPAGAAAAPANVPVNQDPANSWFGGIFSYSLAKNKESGNLYPQVSLGGAFNRRDDMLFSLLPAAADGEPVPEPATDFDGFLGLTLGNGGMLGSHIYAAVQQGADLRDGQVLATGNGINAEIYRADLGVNWPIARNVDGELSTGGAMVRFGPAGIDPGYSAFLKARAFSTLEIINGELVPVLDLADLRAQDQEYRRIHVGLGVNVSLDRGFFWLGLQGIFDEHDLSGYARDTTGAYVYNSGLSGTVKRDESINGALISFGIERNLWWDWLVLRVGGQKEISYRAVDTASAAGKGSYNYIYTNPTGDMSPDDAVGFGIGINVEEKLKVDATLAEDVLYTFGNLLSSPRHHIISRISATYSF